MKPNLKQEAKKLRQEIKRELKAQTSEFSARIQKRRLRRLGAIIALLLLLWLLPRDCATESIPENPSPQLVPKIPPRPQAIIEETPQRPLVPASVPPKNRPKLNVNPPPQPIWLEEFQRQVSARSPLLAKCAEGARAPGLLRWSGSVDPSSGVLSEQAIESVDATQALTETQQECILRALGALPFNFPNPGDRQARRIRLLLEY